MVATKSVTDLFLRYYLINQHSVNITNNEWRHIHSFLKSFMCWEGSLNTVIYLKLLKNNIILVIVTQYPNQGPSHFRWPKSGTFKLNIFRFVQNFFWNKFFWRFYNSFHRVRFRQLFQTANSSRNVI